MGGRKLSPKTIKRIVARHGRRNLMLDSMDDFSCHGVIYPSDVDIIHAMVTGEGIQKTRYTDFPEGIAMHNLDMSDLGRRR